MNEIYPLLRTPMVDDTGRVSKAWLPFFREVGVVLEGVKTGSPGDLVVIGDNNELKNSGVNSNIGESFSVYNDTGGITAGSDWTNLTWTNVSNDSDLFNLQYEKDDIVCLFDGVVKVTYHSTLKCTTYSNQTVIQQKIQLGRRDFVDIGGTLSEGIIKSVNERMRPSCKKAFAVKKHDIIRSVFRAESGSSTIKTVADACNITFERLR